MEQLTEKRDKTSGNVNIKTVFISKDLPQDSVFTEKLSEAGCEVIGQSLISVSPIRYTYTPPTQWVFFSSKNAIRFFFEQEPTLKEGTKFAVMSPVSAKFLADHGKQADFIGEGVDVRQIAKDFARHIGNETVMFPQAIDSVQSIQKELSFSNTCYNLYVYKTSLRSDFEIPQVDVLVFTSPSNAAAYYAKYPVRAGMKVVAMGNTTLNKLKDIGVKDVITAASFDEEGLAEAVIVAIENKNLRS